MYIYTYTYISTVRGIYVHVRLGTSLKKESVWTGYLDGLNSRRMLSRYIVSFPFVSASALLSQTRESKPRKRGVCEVAPSAHARARF